MRRWITPLVVLLVVGSLVGPAAAQPDGTPTDTDGSEDCAFPVSATDASDTTVTLEEEPDRVVTLNPSAAQIMWEIGADEKVVGLTKHAMNLEGADERTNISTGGETINPEIVVELEPDLVLAPSSQVVSEELVETLREAGLTVYYYPSAESIDDVRDRTLITGRFVGACEGAAETVAWMDREIGIVEDAVAGQERPDVLYVFFGFTAGADTFIHEIIEASGGTNIAAEVGISEYQQLSEETVVEEDPDWIILNSNSPEVPDSEAYANTTAVRENQTIVVNINHLNRPGPRIVHAITELAAAFHPDAYESARFAAAETPSPTPTETDTEAATPGGDSDDQPGFGVGLTVGALLVGLLAAKRRSRRGPSGHQG